MNYPLTTADLNKRTSQLKEVTINLAQAAATYDAFTATGDVFIEDYTLYVTTVGATFTSVSIQTDDAVPRVLLTDAEGAVANIVDETNIVSANKALNQSFRLTSGKKIQYTIAGATGTGAMVMCVKYRAISSGATL